MSLPIYQRVAVTDAGDVIPGAEYTVINENTGVAQPIYSDRTGATLLTAPYFADSAGVIQFFIAQGTTFRVSASGGVGTYTDRYVYGVSAAVLVQADGNVGIGTNSPATKLHITKDGNQSAVLDAYEAQQVSHNAIAYTRWVQNASGIANIMGVDSSAGILGTSSNHPLAIRTNNTTAMTIDSSGNVGIGTSFPSSALHAKGGSISTPVDSSAFLANATARLVVNHPNEYGAYAGYLNSTNDAIGIQSARSSGQTVPLSLNPYGGNVGIGTSTSLTNGTLNVESNGTSVLQARSNVAGTIDGDTTVVVSRALNSTAARWSNAVYRGYSHAWSYGSGASNNEAMRIDSSGNLLVGKTSADGTNINVVGNVLKATGANYFTALSSFSIFNRLTTDGDILDFRKDGTTVGQIGTAASNMAIGKGDTGLLFNSSLNTIYPFNLSSYTNTDNTVDLGIASVRFQDIFATNGTIQTSDRNEKQDILEITTAEHNVAKACKGLLRSFRWKSAVEKKGDDARIHFGIIAQDLQDAFTAEGLDAGRYAMFISTTWWEAQIEVEAVEAAEAIEGVQFVQAVEASEAVEAVYNEDNEIISEAVEAVEAVQGVEAVEDVEAVEAKDAYTRTDTFQTLAEAPAGATERTRLGVRYSELLAFIIAAL